MYTVYNESGSDYIELVNEFIANTETDDFTATSMLVAQWIDVCPFGSSQCNEVIRHYYDFNYFFVLE